MTRADIIAGLLLAAGFGAVLWEASSFQYGTEFAPGPGFAPVWLAIIGIGLSLLIAWNAWRASSEAGSSAAAAREPLDRKGLLRVVATLVALAVMLVVIDVLGLATTLFLFLLVLTLGVQRLSLVAGVGASLGTACFVYVVFAYFLSVPVPTGPLGF